MRPFQVSDLEWIEPFASEQGQVAELLGALAHATLVIVEPGEAIGVLWQDIHGTVIGGLTNLPHVKSATKVWKYLVGYATQHGLSLHTHDPAGTFGRKLAERGGFTEDGDAMWLNNRLRRAS